MLWLQSSRLLFWRSYSNPSSRFLASLNPAITRPFLLHDGLVTPIKAAVKGLSVSSASITLIKLEKSFQPLDSHYFRFLGARLPGQKHFVK